MKFDTNTYEIEMHDGVGISPIFNVSYLYPYRKDGIEGSKDQKKIQWEKQMSISYTPQMEQIMDQRIGKKNQKENLFRISSKVEGTPNRICQLGK
jgi:hypothetical protein